MESMVKVRRLVLMGMVAGVLASCGGNIASPATQAEGSSVPGVAPISTPTAAGKFGTRPPTITVTGPLPAVLEASDLITGTGRTAKVGDHVFTQYVVAAYSDPRAVADSTWGQTPDSFTVGDGGVAWGEGKDVVGMKVGGRRELIVPAKLANNGLTDVPAILVVDMLWIGPLPRGCISLYQHQPCAPSDAHFTMSATMLTVGQSVTLKGNDCLPNSTILTTIGPTVAGADGTWSLTATIPAQLYGQDGQVSFTANCANHFVYPNTFAVMVTTPYQLDVLPSTSVTPGTTLTIEPTRSFCSSIDTVWVGVNSVPNSNNIVGNSSSVWPVPAKGFPTDSSGASPAVESDSWHATLTLPSTLAAGTSYVVAACSYSREPPKVYAPTTITVR